MMGDRRKGVIAENTRASETRSGLGFCPLSFAGCVTLSDFWGTLSFCFLTCKAGLITALCKVAFRIKLDNEAFQGKRPASKWRDSPSTNFPLRYSWKCTHQHMQSCCSPGNKKYWSKSLGPLRVSSNQRKEVSLLINKARPFCNKFLAQKLRAQGSGPVRGRRAPCTTWELFQEVSTHTFSFYSSDQCIPFYTHSGLRCPVVEQSSHATSFK